jgi:hypothetical protein
MTDKDIFSERGRSLEEDYFRKKDKELIEKMRRAAEASGAREEMGKRTGLTDPEMLKELEALGFTPDTVVLLPLVPLVQVAWAEGGVTPAERSLVVKLARARGIQEGEAADRQLSDWLDRRPGEQVFSHATRLIKAMLAAPGHGDLSTDDLVKYCESIAAASGGILGMLGLVSAEERQLLATLAAELKGRTAEK